MANGTTDYGKLAYAKITELEKQLAEIKKKQETPTATQVVVPSLALSGGGMRNARIEAAKKTDFDVRVETYYTCNNKSELTVSVMIDGRTVEEKTLTAYPGGEQLTFLFTVYGVEKGVHDVQIQLSADDDTAVATNLIVDLIGADISVLLVGGRLELAKGKNSDAGLLLENGRVRLFLWKDGDISYVDHPFPYCKDACMIGGKGTPQKYAVIYVAKSGRAFVKEFDEQLNQTGGAYLGSGYSACGAALLYDEAQIILLKNQRFYRAIYDFKGQTGGAGRVREMQRSANTVSLASVTNKLALVAEYEGVIRLYRSSPIVLPERQTLSFVLRYEEGEN